MIGKNVMVIVDRPIGSYHPEFSDLCYPVNYGFVQGVYAADGEEQDAYILGVDEPIDEFCGRVIGIVHRKNDVEDKWIVANPLQKFSKSEILQQIDFQERFFDIELILDDAL